MSTNKIVQLIGVLLILVLMHFLNIRNEWTQNAHVMKQAAANIESETVEIELTELTPFQWDQMISFSPYTSVEEIYKKVGYRWNYIQPSLSEGMNQIVFINDGKVVCHIYGYPDQNGFYLHSPEELSLTSADNLTFGVKHMRGYLFLDRMN